MKPSIYDNKYKMNHKNFKSICLKSFPYFLKGETWFNNESSIIYKPFMDDKTEIECWKKYIDSNRTDKYIENKLFSGYIWLVFRVLLFINDVKYNKNNEDEFQESILLLFKCIKLFDMNTDCCFFSYYSESLKKYIKKIKMTNKLFDCGNIKPSTYLIQHLMIVNQEDPNKKIKDSKSAMTLNNTLNLLMSDTDTIENLLTKINNDLFTCTKQIYYTNDKDTREEIYLEDTKDYDYDIKKRFYENRINELYRFLKIKFYKNENKKLKLKDSLNIIFYLSGCMLDENNKWKIVADKTTYAETGAYCKLSRQAVSIKKESIINRIKKIIDIDEIRGILNGSFDTNDLIGDNKNDQN